MKLPRFCMLASILILAGCGRTAGLSPESKDSGLPPDTSKVKETKDGSGPKFDLGQQDGPQTLDLGQPPDGSPPDQQLFPDMVIMDAHPADLSQADLFTPDLFTPDQSAPDLNMLDHMAHDAPLPDLPTPDTIAPDSVAPDTLAPDLLAPDLCPTPCGGVCCNPGQLCLTGAGCTTPIGPCVTNANCFNDSYCHQGVCIPYGKGPGGSSNPSCVGLVPLGRVAPTAQCSWTGPPSGDKFPNHRNVLGTPVVMKFPIPNKGKIPFIAFVSYDRTDGGGQAARCDSGARGVIRIIRGSDCKQLYSVDGISVRASSPLAAGDLDGDKMPELVAYRCGGGLVAVEYDQNSDRFIQQWVSSPSTAGASSILWSGPSIHDLDGDNKPEVLMGGLVFNSAGKLLDGSLGLRSPSGHPGGFAVAADLDKDGVVELADGKDVHQWDKVSKKWVLEHSTKLAPGLVALADFGTYNADPKKDNRAKLDGLAEVVVVHGGAVRVQTPAGRVIFGPVKATTGQGGPPTVGDFDNDGRAEVAFAGYGAYTVTDPDCFKGGLKAFCASSRSDGILWSRASQDHSSSSTGSAIFDFDGDGQAEAIYADECFTRVYDGSSGEVLYSHHHTSCTWYENPIVADVDGDLRSELVVPSNLNCSKAADCTKKNAKLPGTQLAMDPIFRGFGCKEAADCASGVCDASICRCTTDTHCGGASGPYRCGPAVSGTSGKGKVCRSVMLGGTAGIQVLRDLQDKWVSSRQVWNQHTYSVTNINDDGTIPSGTAWKPNWSVFGLNNFRQNVQGKLKPSATPDLTSKPGAGFACPGFGVTISVEICNRGAQTLTKAVPVAVYQGSKPAPGSKPLCTTKTKTLLKPAACEKVSCTIAQAPKSPIDMVVVANDDGTGNPAIVECQGKNNWSLIKGVVCP